MKIIVLALLTSLLAASPQWGGDFEKAKAEAAQNNKYILLNFCGSDWCGPCIKLKKDIFESEDFQQYADGRLVLVRADFPGKKRINWMPNKPPTTKHWPKNTIHRESFLLRSSWMPMEKY